MAIAVSCDSSATVSADAVLDFSITDPSQKAPKFKVYAVRKTSGYIASTNLLQRVIQENSTGNKFFYYDAVKI